MKTETRCGKDGSLVGVFSPQVKQHALRGGFRTRVSRRAGRGRAGRRQGFASKEAGCRWKTRNRNVYVHGVDLRGRPSATVRHLPDTANASSAATAGLTSRTAPITILKANRKRRRKGDLFKARSPDYSRPRHSVRDDTRCAIPVRREGGCPMRALGLHMRGALIAAACALNAPLGTEIAHYTVFWIPVAAAALKTLGDDRLRPLRKKRACSRVSAGTSHR